MTEREREREESPARDEDSKDSAEGEGVAVPLGRRRAEPRTSRRGLALVVGLVGVGAGIAALALGGLKDNAIYSKPVDQLLADRARFAGRPVRAEGNLVHDSLMKRDSPCEYKFVLEKNGHPMPVRFAQCVVPDTFRDVPGMDVVVTVEGEVKQDGTFEATSVLAKCPSKYEMDQLAGKGEKAPHLAIQPGPINAVR